MANYETLGDWCKWLEKNFSPEIMIPTLPARHKARQNPDLVIERNIISVIDMPIFNKITNKVDVVFNGEDPKVGE